VAAEEEAEEKVEVKAEEVAEEDEEKAEVAEEHKAAEELVVRGDQELLTTTTHQRRQHREIVSLVFDEFEILMVGMLGTGWKGSFVTAILSFLQFFTLVEARGLFYDRLID
jgi:hypothetical protein